MHAMWYVPVPHDEEGNAKGEKEMMRNDFGARSSMNGHCAYTSEFGTAFSRLHSNRIFPLRDNSLTFNIRFALCNQIEESIGIISIEFLKETVAPSVIKL